MDIASLFKKAQSEACDARSPLCESNLFGLGGAINWLLDRRSSGFANYAASSGGTFTTFTINPGDPATDISGSSVSYTTKGGLVALIVVPDGTTNGAQFGGNIQVLRDGSLICRRQLDADNGTYFLTIDAPPAGAHTWKLQYGGWQPSGIFSATFNNVKLFAVEIF